jgi:uncharacterized protein (TIRG00374 family)
MPKLGSKGVKYVWYLLRFAIAGAALYLAFRGESFKQVIKVLLGLNLWVFAAALGIYIVSQLIFVARWSLLLRAQSIKIGFWTAARLHFLGLFYNNCLPGSFGGDLLRAWYVTKHTDKKLEAALSVFVDRIVGLTGVFIMAAFCYLSILEESRNEKLESQFIRVDFLRYLTEYIWYFIGFGVAFVIIMSVLMADIWGRSRINQWLQFIRQRSAVVMRKIHDAIQIYYNKKFILAGALLLTFCCQGIFIIALVMIGYSIGVKAHFTYYCIFFPISWLLGLLPISVGGAGVMEWWLKEIFIRVCAVPSGHALVLALCQRLIWLFGSLPGVVIHLMGAHLPKDFFVDYDKSIN